MTDAAPRRPGLNRRTFLRAASVTAGTAAVAAPAVLASVAVGEESAFRHGVASGDPTPDGVLLWTRVTPTPEATPGSGAGPRAAVSWQVAADPDFTQPVARGTVRTGPERDHTVKADVTGLRPGTTYWYRFRFEDTWSPVGRTRTAPASDSDVEKLRFGVVSCSNWEAGHFAAYRALAEREDLDLVLHLGDYIYEYGTGQYAAGGRVIRPTRPSHEILSLADYRIRHGHYRTDPHLQRLHARLPWVITWDDHEVANDSWSGGAENHDPVIEGSWEARTAAARQAYAEWMPVRLGPDGRIHRRLRFGRLAEFSMLDLRTYRSEQTSGRAVDDPDRTITGDPQMEWLREGLSTAEVTWKLVGNSVMVSPVNLASLPGWLQDPLGELLGVPKDGAAIFSDQWDGYTADRGKLVRHIVEACRDVVFLTGDIHTSWANQVSTRETEGRAPAAVEFVVPSVTSDNLDEILQAPENSTSAPAAEAIRASNPHVRWVDTDHHGYGVFSVSPERCQMDFYFLADRTAPDSASNWARGYTVDSGQTTVHRAPAPMLD